MPLLFEKVEQGPPPAAPLSNGSTRRITLEPVIETSAKKLRDHPKISTEYEIRCCINSEWAPRVSFSILVRTDVISRLRRRRWLQSAISLDQAGAWARFCRRVVSLKLGEGMSLSCRASTVN